MSEDVRAAQEAVVKVRFAEEAEPHRLAHQQLTVVTETTRQPERARDAEHHDRHPEHARPAAAAPPPPPQHHQQVTVVTERSETPEQLAAAGPAHPDVVQPVAHQQTTVAAPAPAAVERTRDVEQAHPDVPQAPVAHQQVSVVSEPSGNVPRLQEAEQAHPGVVETQGSPPAASSDLPPGTPGTVVRTIEGRQVPGTVGADGTFLSQDKTLIQTPTGDVRHGVVDPGTNEFLPGGQVRTVDGRPVYGSVDPSTGDWLSEDQKTLEVPGQAPVKGIVDPGTGAFLPNGEVRTVDGQQVYGSVDPSTGNWLSEDQKTLVVPGQDPVHGIIDPETDTFLPNGVVKTIGGSQVYGTMLPDGSFISADDSVIMLPDGKTVTGTLDPDTGIFTGDDGTFDFVSDTGIQPGTKQWDGSLVLGDNTVVMTAASWKADLLQFSFTIQEVTLKQKAIEAYCQTIDQQFSTVESVWWSPAADTFKDLVPQVDSAMQDLKDLLADMVSRMTQTRDNYVRTELTNIQSLDH